MAVRTLINGNMDPQQALQSVMENEPKDVLILFYDDKGTLYTRSSKMNNAEALWMLECAKLRTLNEIIHSKPTC